VTSCDDIGLIDQYAAHLDDPLGDRELVDGNAESV